MPRIARITFREADCTAREFALYTFGDRVVAVLNIARWADGRTVITFMKGNR